MNSTWFGPCLLSPWFGRIRLGSAVIGICLISCVCARCAEQQLSVEDLLNKVADRAQQQLEQPPRREFFRTKTTLELDKRHNVVDRKGLTYHMVIIEGALYPRLVEKNGLPLTPEEQKREQEKEASFRNEPEKK